MRLLLVFLQEPTPGQIKPGLAAEVGDEVAARYYKAMVEIQLKQLQGLQNTRIRFCYTPDDAGDAVKFWILPEMKAKVADNPNVFVAANSPSDDKLTQEVDFHAQGSGSTGQRLGRAFKRGFDDGFENIAAITSDCPECGSRWINMAFARLQNESRDAIVGPNHNGGQYLLALKAHHSELIHSLAWDSSTRQTEKNIPSADNPLTLEQFPPLPVVHNHDDWQQLMNSPLSAALKKNLGIPLENEPH